MSAHFLINFVVGALAEQIAVPFCDDTDTCLFFLIFDSFDSHSLFLRDLQDNTTVAW